MRTPTEFELEQLMHVYDPVKAHEYYIKNRELKGRKKAQAVVPVGRRPAARKDLSRNRKFLDSLPMRQEGASEAATAKFVKTMQAKSDTQLRAEIAKFKAKDAKSAHPSPKGGLEAMTAERVLRARGVDPRKGLTREQISKNARVKQRKELQTQINGLEERLGRLQKLIAKRAREEASENRKAKAEKNRAAKEADKPKTAAEKAEAARENEKYRDKNQQKLKSKSNDGKSGSSSSKTKGKSTKRDSSELRALATRVKGQIAVAKQKLSAL